jgi:hypothetical protein
MISLTSLLSYTECLIYEYMMYIGHIGHFRLDIICYQQHIHKLLLQELGIIKCFCRLQMK